MEAAATPEIVGSRRFPCCGRRARLAHSTTPVDRRCTICRTAWRIEFPPSPYLSERLGQATCSILWRPAPRRAHRGERPEAQLRFEF